MRMRAAIAIQALAITVAGVAIATTAIVPARLSPYESARMPADAQLVLVTSFAGGDTLSLRPLGVGPQLPPRAYIVARLSGIVAPAVGTPDECYGRESLLHLIDLLKPGYVAWAIAEPRYPDALGRWSVYMWTSEGELINAELVTGGFALIDRVNTAERYAVALAAAQARASSRRAGQWGSCVDAGTQLLPAL